MRLKEEAIVELTLYLIRLLHGSRLNLTSHKDAYSDTTGLHQCLWILVVISTSLQHLVQDV